MIPVLWLSGPPGAGKTAVAWEIYSQLVDSGVQTAYVDIDQLGMCYPEPVSDPGRHRMQARNLRAVVTGFAAAGARCVVVSGVVDVENGVHREEVDAVMVRLSAGGDELARRLRERGMPADYIAKALQEADLPAGGADLCVDTDGRSIAEVAYRVRELLGEWPGD